MNEALRMCSPMVDAHAHIFRASDPLRPDAWTRPDYDYRAEQMLADLDAHGIVFGVIAAASLYGGYNDYVLATLSTNPRLRGTVRLQDEKCPPYLLARMRDDGVVGVRFQWPAGELPDLRDHSWRVLLRRMADCGMHAELNIAGERLAQVLEQLEDAPVQLVIDHMGLLRSPNGISGAGYAAIGRAVDAGRAIVKLSGLFRFGADEAQDFVRHLLADFGPERLVWGSDAPFVGHEKAQDYARVLESYLRAVPSHSVRDQICKTALRFYFT